MRRLDLLAVGVCLETLAACDVVLARSCGFSVDHPSWNSEDVAMAEQVRPRIAVVDDEAPIREVLEIGLTLEGFDVRTAFDGVAGMVLVRDWEPACIVLDVIMPKVNGLDLIPIIRKYSSAPIIMLTARGEVRDRIEALKAGADD
jgi:CheY-like chemotaxis protein